jgi:hypothetical protein
VVSGFKTDGESSQTPTNGKDVEEAFVVPEKQAGMIIRHVFRTENLQPTTHESQLISAEPTCQREDPGRRKDQQERESHTGKDGEMH